MAQPVITHNRWCRLPPIASCIGAWLLPLLWSTASRCRAASAAPTSQTDSSWLRRTRPIVAAAGADTRAAAAVAAGSAPLLAAPAHLRRLLQRAAQRLSMQAQAGGAAVAAAAAQEV